MDLYEDTKRNHLARTAHVATMLDGFSRGRAIVRIGAGKGVALIALLVGDGNR